MSRQQSQFSQMLFESPLVKLAKFRAAPAHPGFRDSGPARQHCFVFPRTSVRIRHAGGKPFVASPNVVTLYNLGQVYARESITEEGDRCDWFSVEPSVLIEVLAAHDPSILDDPEHPFHLPFTPGDPGTYLLQRLVVRHMAEAERVDPLFVEETVLQVLDRVAASAARFRGVAARQGPETGAGAAEVVDAVREILARRFRENLSLADLGRRSGYSVFHLSRIFRKKAGMPLHAWQSRLRLLTGLERVAEPKVDLAEVANDLGYASHSHFTAAFRRAFGVTPSAFRRAASARRVRELAGRLAGLAHQG
jgi:AraC family transcriptional regulator